MTLTIVRLKTWSCMPEIFDILNAQGQTLISNIRKNMTDAGQNATGETANSLQFEIKQESTKYKFTLTGRPFFMTVQTGRKPTPGKKPSRDMISNLTRWVNARGLPASSVWAIATKIQEEGTKLWRDGGRYDIVNPATDEFINKSAEAILDNEAETFKIKIDQLQW